MAQVQHCTKLRDGTLAITMPLWGRATGFITDASGVGFVAGNGGVGTKRVNAPPFFHMYFYFR